MDKDVQHLREIMDLKFENTAQALKLQATEIERRLGILNHEAEQLKSMQNTYVPREVYEAKHKEIQDKLDSIVRIVYIGVGGVLVLQIILRFL